jgi:hypothetical protein
VTHPDQARLGQLAEEQTALRRVPPIAGLADAATELQEVSRAEMSLATRWQASRAPAGR